VGIVRGQKEENNEAVQAYGQGRTDSGRHIAIRCGVAAEAEEVGDFLVATQCVLRRSTKTVGVVVSRMKELEKR